MTSRFNKCISIILSIMLFSSIITIGTNSVNADSDMQVNTDYEEYSIKLNGMGASVSPTSVVITAGGIYGELPEPVRANYDFQGWFTAPNGGIEIKPGDSVTEPVPDILYSRWKGAERVVHLNSYKGSLNVSDVVVNYGEKYSKLPTPNRKGLIFTGWYTKKSGGKRIKTSSTVSLTSDTTLYAKWAPTWYLQTDKRWSKKWYRVRKEKSTIGNAGCGPTAMAMVVASLKNPKITPVNACKWSKKNGYKAYLSGTKDGFFKKYGKKYGIKVKQIYYGDLRYTKKKKAKKYHNIVKKSVDKGNWAIVLVGKGRWTSGGHFILWYKTEGNYVYIRDSNSTSSKRAKAKLSTLQKQVKRYWVITVPKSKKVN